MVPRTLHTYTVVPLLPERLAPLKELAYNLRWSWDHPTKRLFTAIDPELWRRTEHNPARLLGLVAQGRLTELAADRAFTDQLDTVYADFQSYMNDGGWWSRSYAGEFGPDFKIAYFSAEFGIWECLPIYSGGLGVLAGDHLKSASDLGLPLAAVGFLYQRGYFRQSLNTDGWQVENYPTTDFYSLPITPMLGADGGPFVIDVDFPGRQVGVQIWKAQVGRVPLYLLDTNLSKNAEADRHIAGNLYGGDNETRIQQEIVLGIGGIHALDAMGIKPTVCHMNEGHSAFLALERVRRLAEGRGLSFADAAEATAAGNLFTTHTPVPAGFDLFPPELMKKYFDSYAPKLGLPDHDALLDRGRLVGDTTGKFNMAVLAFRHARYVNGVSKLHGVVSRQMVQPSVPGFPLDEVPVGSVTNGIHTETFLSEEMDDLLQKYCGELTGESVADPAFWAKVDSIPDAELWAAHEARRARLVEWARQYRIGKMEGRGASEREVNEASEILEPGTLTIGFARRFATYKRGDLMLRDVERIKRIINHAERPVQFVFAGKAHPKDDAGKELIRHIVHFSRDEDVRRRIVFLEDYDMNMARHLVQGVDVWLNNPRRPMEASGTSGMKVIANGGLNFSVLDGWWAEGYDPTVGWEIGRGEDYTDLGYQDHVEAQDIYETLEREIAPLFYQRGADGLPHGWIAKVKASMKKLAPIYTTARMVREYAETYYVTAGRRALALAENDFARARALIVWKEKLRAHWGEVRVESVSAGTDKLSAGSSAPVRAVVLLGPVLTPGDVTVQLYAGPVDADRNIVETKITALALEGKPGSDGRAVYTGSLPSDKSGQLGFTVRVLPSHPDAVLPQELPLITWE
ncbi:MAG: alpha-glucan family phosphorylase [Cytophagales bacterium]|nr:alpha-glucan family phosphorylase [Armatimonadota bacterium]